MINILYFARYRDKLNSSGETIAPSAELTPRKLLEQLQLRGEPWNSTLSDKQLIVAINQEVVSNLDQSIQDGDEVAFFPPVTGG